MRNRLAVGVICLAAAMSVALPRPEAFAGRLAGIGSVGVTGIQVQNLDPAQGATIVIDLYPQDCGAPVSINLPSTAVGAAANIYLPAQSEMRNGIFAAIISSDRNVAALARTDWNATGGAALYSHSQIGHELTVPLVMRDYVGQTSLVTVHNTDVNAPADVLAELYPMGSSTPAYSTRLEICKGTSKTIDLGEADLGTVFPLGFLGAMRLTSASPISAQAFVDIATSAKAVYAFEALPIEAAAETLYAPLIRAHQQGTGTDKLDTGIAVANPSDQAVDVTVTYRGSSGSCTGLARTHGPITIGARASHVFYQGPGGESGLPANCVGSAVVSAPGGKVVAIVNDAVNQTQLSAAYNAMSAADAGLEVALPLFRRAVAGLTSGIMVMNVGTERANAAITFLDLRGTPIVGCGAQCSVQLEPNASASWWPGAIQSIGDGAYGSAVITSDQPVIAIANDYPVRGGVDAAIYNGITADAPPSQPGQPTPAPDIRSVPFVYKGG